MKKYKIMCQHAKFGGVCSGLAYYLDIQTWIVRVIMVCLMFGAGIGLLPYLLVALFAPKYEIDPEDYESICE